MKAYYATPVPAPGEELEFMPDAELQPVHYARPAILDLTQRFVHRSAIAAAEAEAAQGLRSWTVACLCRSLSLENILTFLTGAARLCILVPHCQFVPKLLYTVPAAWNCASGANAGPTCTDGFSGNTQLRGPLELARGQYGIALVMV